MELITHSSSSNILLVKIRDSATGGGKTGLTSASSGLIISTRCDNENAATAYTAAGSTIETVTTLGTYAAPTATKCRFREVDSTNHPGWYELQLADARFAVSSAKRLGITLSGVSGMSQCDKQIELKRVDLQDAQRAGILALPNANPGATGGLLIVGTGSGAINPSGGYVPTLSGSIANQSFSALYTGRAQTWPARLSAANTARDGSGPIVTIAVAGPNGSRVDLVRIVAEGVTTAGFIRLYVSEGNNWQLIDEVPVTAITPSSSVAAFKADWYMSAVYPQLLEGGRKLGASTHNAEKFSLVGSGADY